MPTELPSGDQPAAARVYGTASPQKALPLRAAPAVCARRPGPPGADRAVMERVVAGLRRL